MADNVYTGSGREPLLDADRDGEELEVELFEGMQALIVGVLVLSEGREA